MLTDSRDHLLADVLSALARGRISLLETLQLLERGVRLGVVVGRGLQQSRSFARRHVSQAEAGPVHQAAAALVAACFGVDENELAVGSGRDNRA